MRETGALVDIHRLTQRIAVWRRRLRMAVWVLAILAGVSLGSAVEAHDSTRIDRVKAAFVLNIARFVAWPADSRADHGERLQLCLYRNPAVEQAMTSIDGQKVSGRVIEIRRIERLAANESCNILLIDSDALPDFQSELPPDFDRPMLTIADLTEGGTNGIPRTGIIVSLVRNGARIGFEINLERSRQTGLRMSSELLKLANIVGDDH